MVKRILFIEGDAGLREGFSKLLSKGLAGRMPQISMEEGVDHTIRKFKRSNAEHKYLLIDLDADQSTKDRFLEKKGLMQHKAHVFFMVQEMEAWFLSQSPVLNTYYNLQLKPRTNTHTVVQTFKGDECIDRGTLPQGKACERAFNRIGLDTVE